MNYDELSQEDQKKIDEVLKDLNRQAAASNDGRSYRLSDEKNKIQSLDRDGQVFFTVPIEIYV